MFLNSQTRIKTESRRPDRRVETERVAKRFSLSPGMPRYAGWETGSHGASSGPQLCCYFRSLGATASMNSLNQIVAVVDDDESVCRALRRLLHSAGIRADTFNSGQVFLDLLSASTFSLPACVIADFQMPGMDGLELQRHLAPTGVPIIFCTATDDEGVRKKALARGAAGYLMKPLDAEKLLTVVQLALGRPAEGLAG